MRKYKDGKLDIEREQQGLGYYDPNKAQTFDVGFDIEVEIKNDPYKFFKDVIKVADAPDGNVKLTLRSHTYEVSARELIGALNMLEVMRGSK